MPQSTLEKSVTKSLQWDDTEIYEYDMDKVSDSSIDWGDFYPKQTADALYEEMFGGHRRRPEVGEPESWYWRNRWIYISFIENLKECKRPNHVFY